MPKCMQYGCKKRPVFGMEGDARPSYCAAHKREGMIDIVNKRCQEPGCKKRPVFGMEGDARPSYCAAHKREGMLNIKDKRCHEPGCKKQPTFGMKCESRPSYCAAHRREGMVDILNKKCKGGLHVPGLGYIVAPEGEGTCPYDHKANRKYDGYCVACFTQLFPADPRTPLAHKNSDELKVVSFVLNELSDYEWVYNKPLMTTHCDCTHRRRIDLRLLVNDTTWLAIEVDERQHKDRDAIDEDIRYDDIMAYDTRKWVFVRYNPHSYRNKSGERLNPPADDRLRTLQAVLLETIDKIERNAMKPFSEAPAETLRLFFDA